MAEQKNTGQAAGGVSTMAGAAVLAGVLIAAAVGFAVLRETPDMRIVHYVNDEVRPLPRTRLEAPP